MDLESVMNKLFTYYYRYIYRFVLYCYHKKEQQFLLHRMSRHRILLLLQQEFDRKYTVQLQQAFILLCLCVCVSSRACGEALKRNQICWAISYYCYPSNYY